MTEKGDDVLVIRVAFYSLLVNIILVAVKLALSVVMGSLALRADGIHSLVDVFASIALILGLKISARKSEEFPYGLYKVENIISVVISLLIFLTAYEIIIEALNGGYATSPYSGWLLVVVACLIPVPYLFGKYQVRTGKKFRSPSLIADGVQHKADVLSSLIVFLAILSQYFAVSLDSAAAIVVSVFIVRSGWDILKNGMRVLLDASIDHPTLDQLKAIILAEPLVSKVLRVTGRNSGRYIFVEAYVEVRLNDLERAHIVSRRIEKTIQQTIPNVDRVIIHYEPMKKILIRYAVPLNDHYGAISKHFGDAPFFTIIDLNHSLKKVERQEIISNLFQDVEKGKGIKVAEMLLSKKVDVVVSSESLSGKGPGYALSEAGVELVETDLETVRDFIDEVIFSLKNPISQSSE